MAVDAFDTRTSRLQKSPYVHRRFFNKFPMLKQIMSLLSYSFCVYVSAFFVPSVPIENTRTRRFYLYQPSPMWNTIGLQHVKCVNWSDELGVNGVEDRDAETLVERGEAESGLGQMCKSISEQV